MCVPLRVKATRQSQFAAGFVLASEELQPSRRSEVDGDVPVKDEPPPMPCVRRTGLVGHLVDLSHVHADEAAIERHGCLCWYLQQQRYEADLRSERRSSFLRSMPTANADGQIESEGSVGKVLVGRAFRYAQVDTGPRPSPSACSEKLKKNALGCSCLARLTWCTIAGGKTKPK